MYLHSAECAYIYLQRQRRMGGAVLVAPPPAVSQFFARTLLQTPHPTTFTFPPFRPTCLLLAILSFYLFHGVDLDSTHLDCFALLKF